MSDFSIGGGPAASGHGRISGTGNVNFHGSVFHAGSLRHVSEVGVRGGYELVNLPPEPSPFVGRDHAFDKLRELFAATRVVVVHGLGGMGKSTLAAAFAQTRRGSGPAWWIAAGSSTSIDSGLADLIYALQPELAGSLPMEEATKRARRWLVEHDDWFIVLDDVTDPEDLAALLRFLGGNTGRILVTTRLSYGWHQLGTAQMELGPLSVNASAELLAALSNRPADVENTPELSGPANTAGGSGRLNSPETAELSGLAIDLGGLPLALRLAGALLRQSDMPTAEYRQRLKEAPGSPAPLLASEVINRTLSALTEHPSALPLLRVLSWYSHQPLPVEFLLSSASGAPSGDVTLKDITRALGALSQYGLVHLGDDSVSVHRYVQTLVRTADNNDPLRTTTLIARSLETATEWLDRHVPPVHDPTSWHRWQVLLPHVTTLAERSVPAWDTTVTAHLLNRAGLFLCEQDDPSDALPLLERAYATYRRILQDEHPTALAALGNIARAHQAAGEVNKAVTTFRHTVETCERSLPQDHAVTLGCQVDLAGALLALGSIDEAIRLLERAVHGSRRTLGHDHHETLTAMANLAYAYEVAGRATDAVPLLETTLTGRAGRLGADHPATLVTRHNLAGAYHAVGALQRAIPLFKENLGIRTTVLGDDHPETLTSRNSLAYALMSAGDIDEALPMLGATLGDRERILGPDAPDTITSRSNLAAAYREAGDYSRALALFKQTLRDCERLLGPDHPDTLAARQNLAGIYRAIGRYEEALSLFELLSSQYERLLGPDHQDTLAARSNLAAAYWEKGDVDQALPLLEREVEACDLQLGRLHPDTLAARANLSLALLTLGQTNRALPLLEQINDDHEHILGRDHTATLTIANNLAGAYHRADRLEEAVALYEDTLARRKRLLGSHHPDVLASRSNLSGVYLDSGRRQEAITLSRELLTQCEDVLGEDNPLTRTVRRNLQALTRREVEDD
ncbi:tetratricopeptide repeat protein [Streptomyces sp. DH18]|uniref:tetratricopeptide repeat protein n=1 Tax=Streptomyces sp. DH18 TaxID=3040126 RepID=UPI002442316E|nr:tetratricopeptide repeat protein [Streptomyces sp. DH18]MDG9686141.1 tetratricopeptide repeat protein [Streptomyces sp. DH18]